MEVRTACAVASTAGTNMNRVLKYVYDEGTGFADAVCGFNPKVSDWKSEELRFARPGLGPTLPGHRLTVADAGDRRVSSSNTVVMFITPIAVSRASSSRVAT